MDEKHIRVLDSKEELDAAFEAAKTKYNATEDKSKETTMGMMGSHGLFKFANGACRHGKQVEIEYKCITGIKTC